MTENDIVFLARRAIEGDPDAFDELCRRKTRQMIFHAFTILRSMEDAEEVVQESLVDMFRNIAKLKVPEAFDIWLLRIVQNNAREVIAKRQRRREVLDGEDHEGILLEDENQIPENYFEKISSSRQFFDLIISLPLRQRESVVLYYYEGLSYAEIADLMGTTEKTVGTNLMKAKRRIKSELEARIGGVWP